MTLSDIFACKQHLDSDIAVTIHLDDQGQHDGFSLFDYSIEGGWQADLGVYTASEINAVLRDSGYLPIDKRTRETPFDQRWESRQGVPKWHTFSEWLRAYYEGEYDRCAHLAEKYKNEQYSLRESGLSAEAKKEVYGAFLEQLFTDDVSALIAWATEQEQACHIYELSPQNDEEEAAWFERAKTREYRDEKCRLHHREIAFNQLGDMLAEYRELLERDQST
jgi:hypothetical protein